MKLLRVAVCVSLAACAAGPALAQYGLYGAPDMLQLQPTPTSAANGVAPSAYQVDQGPMVSGAFAPGPVDPTATMLSGTPAPPVPGGQPRSYAPAPVVPTTDPGFSSCCSPSYQPPCAPACGGHGCGCGGQCATGCGLAGCGCDDWTCGQWYGSLLGLALTRDRANKLWTTYEGGNPPNPANQIMNTQQASVGWEGGGEITFGRTFCCNQWSLEATYWTTNQFTGSACASIPGGYVSSPLNTGLVCFGGTPAESWFDGALQHTLNRTDEVNDIELNLIRNRLVGGCGPLDIDLLAGIRFFRFRDNLVWGAQNEGDCSWAYFSDNAENNLIGFQLGFNIDYCICNRLRLFVTPKVGIYDNYISNNFGADMWDPAGNHFVGTQNSYPGQTYPVQSHCNEFSVLTQIDVGLDWQITQCLSAKLGYRLLAATGVALADNQIPFYLNDVPAIQDIDRNGHLLMHGAFVGLTYCF